MERGHTDTHPPRGLVYSTLCSLRSLPTLVIWSQQLQQHVVHRLEIEPLRLLDHAHGTVYLSSSLTARHLSPSRNISRPIYLAYRSRARIDCVKRPCWAYAAYDAVISSHYITLHLLVATCLSPFWSVAISTVNRFFEVTLGQADVGRTPIDDGSLTECRYCKSSKGTAGGREWVKEIAQWTTALITQRRT